jgi:hypothetical protein
MIPTRMATVVAFMALYLTEIRTRSPSMVASMVPSLISLAGTTSTPLMEATVFSQAFQTSSKPLG